MIHSFQENGMCLSPHINIYVCLGMQYTVIKVNGLKTGSLDCVTKFRKDKVMLFKLFDSFYTQLGVKFYNIKDGVDKCSSNLCQSEYL